MSIRLSDKQLATLKRVAASRPKPYVAENLSRTMNSLEQMGLVRKHVAKEGGSVYTVTAKGLDTLGIC